jgi:hypothetical protein
MLDTTALRNSLFLECKPLRMPIVGSTDERKSVPEPLSSRRALPAVIGWVLFALALIAIYAALWKSAPFRETDTADYLNAARAIAGGDMATRQPRTPGFPLFLILVGTGRPFFFVSLALHLIAVALLALVLRSAGVRAWLVRLFILLSVLPPFVQKDAYLLTEGLFEFLMVAGVAGLWLRRRSRIQLLLSGLAFALSTLTRPQNQLFPVLLGILMILYFGWKQGLKFASLLVAPSILLVGGLMANNWFRFHDPNLTYNLGIHLGTRTVTLFDDIPDPQKSDALSFAFGFPIPPSRRAGPRWSASLVCCRSCCCRRYSGSRSWFGPACPSAASSCPFPSGCLLHFCAGCSPPPWPPFYIPTSFVPRSIWAKPAIAPPSIW